jgi:hypothetical protein
MKRSELPSTSSQTTSPSLAPETTCADADDDDDNHFGLKDDAVKWIQQEMLPYGDEAYLLPINHYRPLVLPKDGIKIPATQFQTAAAEYERRSKAAMDRTTQPVLVAVGVNDVTMRLFHNDEEGPTKKARYLFFPTISWREHRGALFVTYMPGPAHGGVDAYFIGEAQSWRTSCAAVETVLDSGCSSGAHNAVQPDHRFFPYRKYRDKNGNDKDKAHHGLPHTRMYWEIEYDHRKIGELRQHGANLMRRTPYTRLFLGATISKPDPGDDDKYEAAIVLWGKADDGAAATISVLDAVSFGTRGLSDATKAEYSKIRQDRLPEVGADAWRRPDNADETPVVLASPTTPGQWLLHVPFTRLLYKVMTGKRKPDEDRTYEYLLDTLCEGEVKDLVVDLLRMSYSVYMKTNAAVRDDESNDENEA